MTSSERQLIDLVRSSLWQEPVDKELFSNDIADWQKIGNLALQQTVGILAFEGALSLPDNLLPPKEWIQRALAFIETNRRTHILVDKCVAEAVTRLKAEGINSVLLKGQAYARTYPKSEMRQCGDIDLYVGEDNYHGAYSSVKGFGWKSKETFSPQTKHYGCELRGVRIELHRRAAKLVITSVDRKFQEWSQTQISLSDRTIHIAGREIPIPTPTFDIVFVFLHLYHHFLNGGVGLRHICDWTMLLHVHSKEINLSELEQILKDLKFLKAWKSFAPILVLYLGLPESECPFYSKEYEKRSKRVLSDILKEGNFGRAKQKRTKRPEGYLAGKLYSLRSLTISHMNKIWFDPTAIMRSFSRYLFIGTAQILKDLTKKHT